jgi:uncharacterized protein with HEPN domain
MRHKVLAILNRMIEDGEDIVEFIKPVVTSADLSKDRMRKKALSQSILNLGENTKLLEKWLDLTLTSIDWRGLKGMREVAAYLGGKGAWEAFDYDNTVTKATRILGYC